MTLGGIIFGALVGSFSAFMFNLLLQIMIRKADNRATIKQALTDVLETARDEGVSYWSGEFKSGTKHKILSEAKIKLLAKTQPNLIDSYVEANNKTLYASDRVKLSEFKNQAFELLTGGDFEGVVTKDLSLCKRIALLYTNVLIIIKKYN